MSFDDPVIRHFDRKIQDYEKKQEEYISKIESAKAQIERFQETKQQFLEGLFLEEDASNNLAANFSETTARRFQETKPQFLEGLFLEEDASNNLAANFSETTARSLVKSMMWRLVAGSATFFTSLRFSGSISTALLIVGSDFFSKAATMFFGERLMNKSQAGRKCGVDDVGRSLAKALIWRLFAICNTLTMSFVIAKNFSMASKIAGSDAVFKTGLMFVYERAWAKVDWGKEYLIELSSSAASASHRVTVDPEEAAEEPTHVPIMNLA
eukprot:CAMPEP_0183784822 /NCGR_PEP_ID=MMETSP0739-20130205/66186_1 /TAXON_ID=385413 /ORGANISM="Thalassiosira miniscula, Strain CCMP1093" /LENGTH=267 /DNA_ID=CAMNT_0026028809 /DNA_START=268 /DNA_END=1071 /DNA_ORIENTATION=-